jgi:hypothetical protein
MNSRFRGSRIGTVHDPLTAHYPRTLRECFPESRDWLETYKRPARFDKDWIVAIACALAGVVVFAMAATNQLPGG